MSTMTISEARARFSDVADRARIDKEPVYLTKHDRPIVAIIDADQLNRLLELAEDIADIEAARQARAEMTAGEVAIPWEEAKQDLGLA